MPLGEGPFLLRVQQAEVRRAAGGDVPAGQRENAAGGVLISSMRRPRDSFPVATSAVHAPAKLVSSPMMPFGAFSKSAFSAAAWGAWSVMTA